MTKDMVMALVRDLMEKSGDLAITVANGENTSGAEWTAICAMEAVSEAIDKLVAES